MSDSEVSMPSSCSTDSVRYYLNVLAEKLKSSSIEDIRHRERRWTYDELVAELPEANQPVELWDGQLITSPSLSFFHQQVIDRFHDALKAWVRHPDLGQTVRRGFPVAIKAFGSGESIIFPVSSVYMRKSVLRVAVDRGLLFQKRFAAHLDVNLLNLRG
jgi:hypothetical protein